MGSVCSNADRDRHCNEGFRPQLVIFSEDEVGVKLYRIRL